MLEGGHPTRFGPWLAQCSAIDSRYSALWRAGYPTVLHTQTHTRGAASALATKSEPTRHQYRTALAFTDTVRRRRHGLISDLQIPLALPFSLARTHTGGQTTPQLAPAPLFIPTRASLFAETTCEHGACHPIPAPHRCRWLAAYASITHVSPVCNAAVQIGNGMHAAVAEKPLNPHMGAMPVAARCAACSCRGARRRSLPQSHSA